MPDDHSEVVPLLPIPNRTVKRLCADDSAGSRVKVGHCQAINGKAPEQSAQGLFSCSPSMGAIFGVQVPGRAGHSEASEAQLREGDRAWGGSVERKP